MQDKIPVTLITDNMAGYTMKTKHRRRYSRADCIAANGYRQQWAHLALAVLADYYDIPFYQAPLSTINTNLPSGDSIPIEERDPDEVRQIKGNFVTVPEVEVYSPAFDVTPH